MQVFSSICMNRSFGLLQHFIQEPRARFLAWMRVEYCSHKLVLCWINLVSKSIWFLRLGVPMLCACLFPWALCHVIMKWPSSLIKATLVSHQSSGLSPSSKSLGRCFLILSLLVGQFEMSPLHNPRPLNIQFPVGDTVSLKEEVSLGLGLGFKSLSLSQRAPA